MNEGDQKSIFINDCLAVGLLFIVAFLCFINVYVIGSVPVWDGDLYHKLILEYINNGYFNFCAIGVPIVTGDFILHGGTVLCTTSTTTTFPVCYEFTLQSTVLENIVFNYVACNGTPGVIVLNNNIATICAISVTPPTAPENKWNLFIGFEC